MKPRIIPTGKSNVQCRMSNVSLTRDDTCTLRSGQIETVYVRLDRHWTFDIGHWTSVGHWTFCVKLCAKSSVTGPSEDVLMIRTVCLNTTSRDIIDNWLGDDISELRLVEGYVIWTDVSDPTGSGFGQLAGEFGFHHLSI